VGSRSEVILTHMRGTYMRADTRVATAAILIMHIKTYRTKSFRPRSSRRWAGRVKP
jgi:hypothetical protein